MIEMAMVMKIDGVGDGNGNRDSKLMAMATKIDGDKIFWWW